MSCDQCDALRFVAEERAQWTDKLREENAKLREALERLTAISERGLSGDVWTDEADDEYSAATHHAREALRRGTRP